VGAPGNSAAEAIWCLGFFLPQPGGEPLDGHPFDHAQVSSKASGCFGTAPWIGNRARTDRDRQAGVDRLAGRLARSLDPVYSRSVKLISWNVNGLRALTAEKLPRLPRGGSARCSLSAGTRADPDDVEQLCLEVHDLLEHGAKEGLLRLCHVIKTAPCRSQTSIGLAKHDQEGVCLPQSSSTISS